MAATLGDGPPSHEDLLARIDRLSKDRARWLRLYTRLEHAVARHERAKAGTGFTDDADEALHDAWRKILNASTECDGPHTPTP